MAALTVDGMAAAYGHAAPAWADGPDRLYSRLAEALVAACPSLAGRLVLDVGAGTGAQSRAIEAAGGEVVATDIADGMLAHRHHADRWAVASDTRQLPFADAVFDAVLAGFVVNHLTDPAVALREAARVTRRGGTVAASTFASDWSHPAKEAIQAVAHSFGYRPPRWYLTMKADSAPAAGHPDTLTRAAGGAGLERVRAVTLTVDGGLHTPEAVVAWRLGMAHLAPFVAGLGPEPRRDLVAAAVAAVGPRPPAVRPRVVVLTARVS